MKKRILLVDATELFRDQLSVLLRRHGFDITTAQNGTEASLRFHDPSLNLMIFDIQLPGTQGLDLLQRLHRSNPALPIIVLTSITDRSHVMHVAQLGIRDYLIKNSLSTSQLLERIQRLLHPEYFPDSPALAAAHTHH